MRDDLRAYLDRIMESECLGRGARRPALLAYLLRLEAANEGDRIKAYSIGIDVFGKPTDFAPTTDSSVRVEVGRLRAAIALFEASEWADTAIKVEIPIGTYQPKTTKREIGNQDDALTATSENAVDKQPPMRRHQITLTVAKVFGLAAIMLVAAFPVFDWRAASRASSTPRTLVIEEFRGDLLGMELKHLIEESYTLPL